MGVAPGNQWAVCPLACSCCRHQRHALRFAGCHRCTKPMEEHSKPSDLLSQIMLDSLSKDPTLAAKQRRLLSALSSETKSSPQPVDSAPPSGPQDPILQFLAESGLPQDLESWLGIAYPEANSLDDLDAEQRAEVPPQLLPKE